MRESVDDTLKHLRFLAKLFGKDSVRYVVMVLLMEIGIPTNYDGFEYLVRAVTVYFQDSSLMFVKGLYPAIAESSEKPVDSPQVESAIRTVIKAAWEERDSTAWNRYFHESLRRPSNTEFISRIARMVEIWEGCCLEEERKNHKGVGLYER